MVVERDIVLVSVPFALGVAASAFFAVSVHAALLFFYSCILLLLLLCSGRGKLLFWYLCLFFSLGYLCGGAAELFGTSLSFHSRIADRALESFCRKIDSLNFSHQNTGALLRALLTGQRDMLPQESIRAFRAAGASHILALSGLHLGMIYLIAGKLLLPLGNSRTAGIVRSVLLVGLSGFYAVMTGASPSIVRAFLFIAINEWVRNSPGRKRKPLNVWCAALMIQLALSPEVISSVGFQLSYLAMLGIFTLFPEMESWYPRSGNWDLLRKVWSMLALSCSCQIFTAPLAWYRFGSFPMYFLLTNLLAMPLTSLLMGTAIACIALSALGLCPDLLIITTDSLAEALQGCLDIISKM